MVLRTFGMTQKYRKLKTFLEAKILTFRVEREFLGGYSYNREIDSHFVRNDKQRKVQISYPQ